LALLAPLVDVLLLLSELPHAAAPNANAQSAPPTASAL
jgi:hypothetical protein